MTSAVLTIGHLERGGAELRTLQAIEHIRSQPDAPEITLFVVSGVRGSLASNFENVGVKLFMGAPGLLGLWRLYGLLRSSQVDVFHANASLAGGFYTAVAWLANVPIRIAHIRSTAYDNQGILRKIKNMVFRIPLNYFSSTVIGVVDACRDFSKTPPSRWRTLYNGITPPKILPLRKPSQEVRIILLGRVSTPKNPLRALEILSELRKNHGDIAVRLDVVGRLEQPLAEVFLKDVSARGLDEYVQCHGVSNTPFEWLQSASVLLLPSFREGLPGVVLEALSVGTPVVSADLPGVREIARYLNGITIVNLADPNSHWAQAIIDASRNQNHQQLIDSFNESPFQFLNHCEELLALWQHGSSSDSPKHNEGDLLQ